MDPFEVRLQFVSLLGRLTSSLASITKVSSFALKHGPRCGDDIWDCLVDECSHVSLNARINLLYFLDSLLDKEGPPVEGNKGAAAQVQPYKGLVKRDLAKVVDMVVPKTKEGVLNLMSANQVLRSWRTRRLLDTDILDAILAELDSRKETLHSAEADSASFSTFSRNDILRRIEDDRERHKRLRERIWVLPVPSTLLTLPSPAIASTSTSATPSVGTPSSAKPSPVSPASPSEFGPTSKGKSRAKQALSKSAGRAAAAKGKEKEAEMPPPPVPAVAAVPQPPARGPELALEIEFEQLWEASEEEMRRALWIREDGVELDEDPEGEIDKLPSPQVQLKSLNGGKSDGEDEEMEEGEEKEEGEVEDDPSIPAEEKAERAEERPPKRRKKERGRRNSRGGWELDDSERAAMRREVERCFAAESEQQLGP